MTKKTLLDHLSVLPDPRKTNHSQNRHELLDIVIVAILAVIAGADTWVEIADFGRTKEAWLKKFLALPNGIPSHDTFGRVFAILNPDAFEKCFRDWVRTLHPGMQKEVIALDGKSVRRSHKKGMKPLHLVSAFAAENGVILGQRKVDGKTNEITVIPELLETLHLHGAIVTIDAMGTQGWIARKIIENKGDYVLVVKGNQRRLLADVKRILEAEATDSARTAEESHGRKETRECVVSDHIGLVRDRGRWTNIQSIARVTSKRIIQGKTSAQSRYFISSLKADAQEILSVVRAHWKIENTLHWSLDVAFREDESRVRIKHAGENLALVRKIAMNLLRKDRAKAGLKARRLKAAWDESYLWSIIEMGS